MKNRRWILSVAYIVLGVGLFVASCLEAVDSFWAGMGTGLLMVGVLRLIQFIRYRSNPDYQEKVETESKDERNRFLSMKAWSWAGYLFVFIAAVGTIVFKLLAMDQLMMLCSGGLCLLLVLYWVSYLILRKKY